MKGSLAHMISSLQADVGAAMFWEKICSLTETTSASYSDFVLSSSFLRSNTCRESGLSFETASSLSTFPAWVLHQPTEYPTRFMYTMDLCERASS